MIVPAWPSPVAAACKNVTEPKFVRGRVRQRPDLPQTDGASAIHSAEERSGSASTVRCVKRVCRVRFVIWRMTSVPRTSTAPVIVSPGATFRRIVTGGAGTISYQSEYSGVPPAVQSDSLPTCSSAWEVSEKPPRPTQNAE